MQEPDIGSGELWRGVESAFRVRAGCETMLQKMRQLQDSRLGLWGPARPAPDGFLDGISSARLGFAAQAEGGGRCAAWSSAHLSLLSRFPGAGAGAGSGWRPGLRPGAVDPSAGVAPRGRLWVGPGDWAGMEPRSPMLGPHRPSLRPGRHSDPRPVVEF